MNEIPWCLRRWLTVAAGAAVGAGITRTGIVRRRSRLVADLAAVESDAPNGEDHEQDHARHDAHVGNIVDRRDQPGGRDEVNDMSETEAGLTEEPVGQVAQNSGKQEPEDDSPRDGLDPSGEPDDENDDTGSEDREDPGHPACEGKSSARVPNEVQLQHIVQNPDNIAVSHVADNEELCNLIERVTA